jgi:hypothetical protein
MVKRNVKIIESEMVRDTFIDSVMKDNSLFKQDNDIIDLRR